MPSGVYELDAPDGSVVRERFSCAAGPAGWRYVASRSDGVHLDLTLRSDGRPYRLEVRAPQGVLRGGASGGQLLWGSPHGSFQTDSLGFTGASPALLIATARLAERAGERVLRVARLDLPALTVLQVRQRWQQMGSTSHPTDLGPLPVQHWGGADLDTGERHQAHLAGDVLLAADGPVPVRLVELAGPPTLG